MNDTVLILSLVTAITTGTPLLYAALGETLAERSGVMNLGVEGMMLVGAVTGFWVTSDTGSLIAGMIVGGLAAAALAVIHAVLAISLGINQIISGLALVIIGTGLSGFLGAATDPPLTTRPPGAFFTPVFGTGMSDLPIVGPLIFGHDIMVYTSWILVAAASFYLFRTRQGLYVWAVGEDPATADAAGISVMLYRYVHTLVGGFAAGIGGAYLSVSLVGTWQDSITAGAGWIAFSLVIFSGWRPWRALYAAYVFGALISLGFTLQIIGAGVPTDVLAMVPFILTIVALAIVTGRPAAARKLGAPSALSVPYSRENR